MKKNTAKSLFITVLAVMFAAGFLVSCGGEEPAKVEEPVKTVETPAAPAASGPKTGGTLVIGRSGDTVGLDPSAETDGHSMMIIDNIFERLVAYVDEGTDTMPGLATSWDISSDGLTYTFHLREGVKFHDGTDFDADAVIFSLGRQMKEPNIKYFKTQWDAPAEKVSPEYWLMMDMDNTVASIEATDLNTVVFKMKKRNAPFINNLGMHFASIVSPTAMLKHGKSFMNNPSGTGPFELDNWVKGDRVILKANLNYWGGRPYLDKAIFRAIPENSVRYLELKTGNIDLCHLPAAEDVALAKKDDNLKVISQPGLNVGYLSFGHKKDLWKDKVVRQAIAHAINKKAIVDNIYYGVGEVAKNGMPPTLWGYNDDVVDYAYDPEKSKELLAQTGFFDKMKAAGQDKITLWCMPVARPYNPSGMKVGEAMQADLKKVGIEVELVTFEWGTYLDKQRSQPPEMDLFQLGWTGDNGDPDNFLAVLYDGLASPAVRTQWHNEEYHKLMLDGVNSTSKEERVGFYKKAQAIMHDEVAAIPIAHALQNTPMKKGVMNFKNHPFGNIYLKKVWKE